MARTRKSLTETHLSEYAIRDRAREVGEPEHFFVGLRDGSLPQPRNILMFCKEHLSPTPKDEAHHRCMLILNMESEISTLVDGLILRLVPGQALLVLPFQAHRYLTPEKKRVTWLFLTFELSDTDALEELRNRPIDIPPELWSLVDILIAEYQAARRAQKPADEVAALLSFLLLRLLRQCRRSKPADWDTHLPLPAHRLVQRACRLIVTRLSKPITVTQVASELGVSAGYLRNCFHQVVGLRVTGYIRRTRIHAAAALLSRSESNITQIAEHCGFGSVYAFSRAFTREIGMAPTRYRAHLWNQRNLSKPTAKA